MFNRQDGERCVPDSREMLKNQDERNCVRDSNNVIAPARELTFMESGKNRYMSKYNLMKCRL